MNLRLEQIKNTIKVIQKHQLKAFKAHSIMEDFLCTCGAYKCTSQGKHPVYKDWKTGPFLDKLEQFVIRSGELNLISNIGIKTGDGITVIDFDSKESYLSFINNYPHLDKTLTVKTSKGFHLYFSSKIKMKNRVKFLPDTDLRSEGGYVIAPGSAHISGSFYEWVDPDADILEFPYDILEQKRESEIIELDSEKSHILEGGRNDFLFKESCKIMSLGLSRETANTILHQLNMNLCKPPLDDLEVLQILESSQKTYLNRNESPEFDEKNMYGIIGKVVEKIAPHTEACPVAVYVQMLTLCGNFLGRIASFHVSGDKHFPNLMTLLVGDSAIARKGTSLGIAISIFNKIIPEYVRSNLKSGATSAEGIIFHNRDPIYEVKEKKGKLEKVLIDSGITDKRLLVIETEFGSILISMKREGNKLSTTLRDAYDSKNLSTLSKNNPVKSTNPHISIIAHITIEELKHLLNAVDVFNGFGNRFLFIHTKTNKILPEAPSIDDLNLNKELDELSEITSFWEKRLNELCEFRATFSTEAQSLWNDVYTKSMKYPETGIVGTLSNRNLIHVKKIALILAMLDKELIIDKHHLEAALEVGKYSLQSIKHIFKDSNYGLSKKQRNVISFLESNISQKATRTEVSKGALGKNSSRDDIESLKNDLVERNLITIEKNENVEIWKLSQGVGNEN